MNADNPMPRPKIWYSRWIWLGIGALMFVVLLWSEHRDHLLGWFPYLFVLICPLMHFFMHGSHRHHHHQKRNEDPPAPPRHSNSYTKILERLLFCESMLCKTISALE